MVSVDRKDPKELQDRRVKLEIPEVKERTADQERKVKWVRWDHLETRV